MKHITQILLDNGYNPYLFIKKTNWNKDAKRQSQNILEAHKDSVIFISGDFESEESAFYVPTTNINSFSSMRISGLSITFAKDRDFENTFVWGLREGGKPPTLISPRPEILVKKVDENGVYYENESFDDSMNLVLTNEDHSELFSILINKIPKIYNYDLTTKN